VGLDHQRFCDRLELATHAFRIGLCVPVPDDDAHTAAPVDLARQLDDPVQGAVEGADALERSDQAVANAEDRFHLQDRAEQRACAPDLSATSQEFQGRD
jgi:hypothetical protein